MINLKDLVKKRKAEKAELVLQAQVPASVPQPVPIQQQQQPPPPPQQPIREPVSEKSTPEKKKKSSPKKKPTSTKKRKTARSNNNNDDDNDDGEIENDIIEDDADGDGEFNPKNRRKSKARAAKSKKKSNDEDNDSEDDDKDEDDLPIDDSPNYELLEQNSKYNKVDSSFVVSAIPVARATPTSMIYLITVLAAVVDSDPISVKNGELELENADRHNCSLLKLWKTDNDAEHHRIVNDLSLLREKEKAAKKVKSKDVKLEQMYAMISDIPLENRNGVLYKNSVNDFACGLLQYQLRVRLDVDQFGSNQLARACIFMGTKMSASQITESCLLVTPHEYSRYFLGLEDSPYRRCLTGLPITNNCAAFFDLVGLEPRAKEDYGMEPPLIKTTDPLLVAEREKLLRANNFRDDFIAQIEKQVADKKDVDEFTFEDFERETARIAPKRVREAMERGDDDEEENSVYDEEGFAPSDNEDGTDDLGDNVNVEQLDAVDRVILDVMKESNNNNNMDEDGSDAQEQKSLSSSSSAPQPPLTLQPPPKSTMKNFKAKFGIVISESKEKPKINNNNNNKDDGGGSDNNNIDKSNSNNKRDTASSTADDYRMSNPEMVATRINRPSGRVHFALPPVASSRKRGKTGYKSTIGAIGCAPYDCIRSPNMRPMRRSTLMVWPIEMVRTLDDVKVQEEALKSFNLYGIEAAKMKKHQTSLAHPTSCTHECLKNLLGEPSQKKVLLMMIGNLQSNRERVDKYIKDVLKASDRAAHMTLRSTLVRHFDYDRVIPHPSTKSLFCIDPALCSGLKPQTLMFFDAFGDALLPEYYWALLPILGRQDSMLCVANGVCQYVWRLLSSKHPHSVLFTSTLRAVLLPCSNGGQKDLRTSDETDGKAIDVERKVGLAVRRSEEQTAAIENFLVHRAISCERRPLICSVLAYAVPRIEWGESAPAEYFDSDALRTDVTIANRGNILQKFDSVLHTVTLALTIFRDLTNVVSNAFDACVIGELHGEGLPDPPDLRYFYPKAREVELAIRQLSRVSQRPVAVFELQRNYILHASLCCMIKGSVFREFGVDCVRVDTIEVLENAFARSLVVCLHTNEQRRALVVVEKEQDLEHYAKLIDLLHLNAKEAKAVGLFSINDVLKNDAKFIEWKNDVSQSSSIKTALFMPRADRLSRFEMVRAMKLLTSRCYRDLWTKRIGSLPMTQSERDLFAVHDLDAHQRALPENAAASAELQRSFDQGMCGDYLYLGGLAMARGTHLGFDTQYEPSIIDDLFFSRPLTYHRNIVWDSNLFTRSSTVALNLLVWSDFRLQKRFDRRIDLQTYSLRCSYPTKPRVPVAHRLMNHSDVDAAIESAVDFLLPLKFISTYNTPLLEARITEARDEKWRNLWALPLLDIPLDGVVDRTQLMGHRNELSTSTRCGYWMDQTFKPLTPRMRSSDFNVNMIICDSVHDNQFLKRPSNADAASATTATTAASSSSSATPKSPSIADPLVIAVPSAMQLQRQNEERQRAEKAREMQRQKQQHEPPRARIKQTFDCDFTMTYEDCKHLATTPATIPHDEKRYNLYRNCRMLLASNRIEATAGFNIASIIGLAACPPRSVIWLGSFEQSILARFAARYRVPAVLATPFELSTSQISAELAPHHCYMLGSMTSLPHFFETL